MAERALDGLRVVDISQGIAGPYATKLLADNGLRSRAALSAAVRLRG
jgi:crotonobetainyl-CoA:carnitine CoA-transferase CaiB-like acyl-CoA transferase